MRAPRRLAVLQTLLVLALVPMPAWGQATLGTLPPLAAQQLQQLQEIRAEHPTLTPSLRVYEQYTDNVFLDNRHKQADWITGFVPGVSFVVDRRSYGLRAEYNFTAELYARNSDQDDVFNQQNFLLEGFYQPNPRLRLTLADAYVMNVNTNLISSSSVATGRTRSWSNSVLPGVAWQINPATAARVFGSYTVQRFQSSDLENSDVYHLGTVLERHVTSRLIGTAGYDFAYFDVRGEEKVTAHTPSIGVSYNFTNTLAASATGGPTFSQGEKTGLRITPTVTASLSQAFRWGSASVEYGRFVGTAGGLGGPTDDEVAGASLRWTTLAEGLYLDLGPRYTRSKSVDTDTRINVQTFTVGLHGAYRLTRWIGVFAGYNFFRQRSDGTQANQGGALLTGDVDQNTAFVGLQLARPR